jgi:hypothetical protein
MATIVDLTDQEIAELKQFTNEEDVETAIRTAMREYLRYVRRMQLIKSSGRVKIQDNWMELENRERKPSKDDSRPGTD